MLHQRAKFIATMGVKSESGWVSGSHCRVLCSWSSISVMCGWMDLNSPTVFCFAPHAFLCLNPLPKSHWRSQSPLGIKREATKVLPSMCLPITDHVAGTCLIVVEVHSLGLGRCTCKIETSGCSSYLFAGRCVVCLCLWAEPAAGTVLVLVSSVYSPPSQARHKQGLCLQHQVSKHLHS